MKVMTIFGTRAEIIKLNLVLKVLDQHCEHTIVHTGEDSDESLSGVFFRELEIRKPDIELNIKSKSFGDLAGLIFSKVEAVLDERKPDRVLVLGGTDSALSATAAARRQIPIFHMEAGNRCFDDNVSAEANRKAIDRSSSVLMPYTARSKDNLISEGFGLDRIFVTGHPIKEVLDTFADKIEASTIMDALGAKSFEYFLVTLHKGENINNKERLDAILDGLAKVAKKFGKSVLLVAHPRTAEKLEQYGLRLDTTDIRPLNALGFFDFIKLEKNSLAVLTDSGTVQDECAILNVPNITVRDITDRPETIECGSTILSGATSDAIVRAVELAIAQPTAWTPPAEYLIPNVSQTVSRIVLGKTAPEPQSSL